MTESVVLDDNYGDIDEELIEEQTQTKIIFKSGSPKNVEDITEEELQSLYQTFDISSDEINKRFSSWRLDVIHIRGVQNMSSEDVLKYFDDFEPKSIEWVNDLSCNVVFDDRKASASALKALTTALVFKSSSSKTTTGLAFEVIDAESLSVPIPPPFRWALGLNHHKSKALLLRFATTSDKKSVNTKHNLQFPVTNDPNMPNDTKHLNNNPQQFKMKAKRFRMRADEEEQQRMLVKERIASPSKIAKLKGSKSIWDRLQSLDKDSLNRFAPSDAHLIQVSIDNTTNSNKSVSSEPPLRSTISVVDRRDSGVNRTQTDLRNRIKRKL